MKSRTCTEKRYELSRTSWKLHRALARASSTPRCCSKPAPRAARESAGAAIIAASVAAVISSVKARSDTSGAGGSGMVNDLGKRKLALATAFAGTAQ